VISPSAAILCTPMIPAASALIANTGAALAYFGAWAMG
jgi:hypothetical protein